MNKKFPIYRDAHQLVIETETAVKQFSRYHKYTLGSELRLTAYNILENISLAINQSKSLSDDKKDLIKKAHRDTERFKIKIQIAQTLNIFPSFKRFEILAKIVISISKQCSAWQQKIATPQYAPTGGNV